MVDQQEAIIWISNKISSKCVPDSIIDNLSALVQIMAWRQIGDKPWFDALITLIMDKYIHHGGNCNRSLHIFIQENGFENIVKEVVSILS